MHCSVVHVQPCLVSHCTIAGSYFGTRAGPGLVPVVVPVVPPEFGSARELPFENIVPIRPNSAVVDSGLALLVLFVLPVLPVDRTPG